MLSLIIAIAIMLVVAGLVRPLLLDWNAALNTAILIVAGLSTYVVVYELGSAALPQVIRHRYAIPAILAASLLLRVRNQGGRALRLMVPALATSALLLSATLGLGYVGRVATAATANASLMTMYADDNQQVFDSAFAARAIERGELMFRSRGRRLHVFRPLPKEESAATRLQTALDSLPVGDGLVLAPGDYALDQTIRIPSRVLFAGSGMSRTTLKSMRDGRYGGGILRADSGSTDVTVARLKVDGSAQRDRGAGVIAGILLSGVQRASVRETSVRWTSGDCVNLSGASTDGWIDRNIFEHCGRDGGDAHGILVASRTDTITWHNRAAAVTCRHRITRNVVRQAENTGIMLYNACDVVVVANRVIDSRRARGINSGPTSGRLTIVGNVIERAHSTGIHFYSSGEALVVGNTVTGTVVDGSGIGIEGQGIKAYVFGSGFRIWGNTSANNATDGIALMAGASHASIGGNIISGNGRDGIRVIGGGPSGLPVADVTDVEVSGNVIEGNRGIGLNLSAAAGGRVRDVRVSGNTIVGNARGATQFASSVCGLIISDSGGRPIPMSAVAARACR